MLRSHGTGGLFSSSNPQDSSALTAPIFGTKGSPDRHIRGPSLKKIVLWGSCHICKNEVPFHHLRTNGLSLKRDPQSPEFQHRFWTRVLEVMKNEST